MGWRVNLEALRVEPQEDGIPYGEAARELQAHLEALRRELDAAQVRLIRGGMA